MSLALALVLACIVLLTTLGFPIGLGLIASGALYLVVTQGDMGLIASQIMYNLSGNFLALAVPLFIFAARVMNTGTVTDRLLGFVSALVGRFRGGLAQVNIVTSVIFAGMSGSGVADAAGVGTVLYRMMTKDGRYPRGYAAAVTVASSTIGPIIPPSIPMVLYALVSGSSVGALFLGGVLPGLFMAGALGVLVWFQALRYGFPVEGRIALSAIPRLFVRAFLPMLTPVILLGGIYTGVFTPTEAAAVAAFYALLLTTLAYRDFGPLGLYRVLVATARESSIVLLLLASTYVFNYIITLEQVPQRIAAVLAGLQVSNLVLMLIIMVVFLLLGALLDGAVILLVAVPLVMPTLVAHDINLIHFGVIMSVNVMIGGLTPPFGLLLFVLNSLTGAPLKDIIRAVWPFIFLLVGCLAIMTIFPQIVLWLPTLMGYR